MALLTALLATACSGPPPLQNAEVRGVGTPGVSTYLGSNQATSLQALLDRCRAVPAQSGDASGDRGLGAACSQLHRTLHNQPGNTMTPSAEP
ncbi:MAG: hypothetical protein HIU92_19240 [Proteobacteria bacterium]|nr:hypothetical protein [Pseudomonadota bacterium]